MDRYLPIDYEDMDEDWCVPKSKPQKYAKAYARWEEIEKEKALFRETHDLTDLCIPNHAPEGWRTGDPLPPEWERS